MTFFYDLNKKLDTIREKPETKQLNEGAVAEASYSAKAARAGKDIGKPGKAFAQIAKSAGEKYGSKERGEKVAGAVLNKLRHPKEDVEEGALGSIVQKIGGAAKKAGSAVLNKLGHGSDADMMRDLQRKMGVPQTGEKPQQPKEGVDKAAFAKLAPPKDKITFADKIVGAKKEVDEMLGDVAAEAMKNALKGGQKKLDVNKNGKLDKGDFAALRKGKKVVADEGFPTVAGARAELNKRKVGDVTHGAKHDVEEIPGGRRVTRRVDDKGYSVGSETDDEGNAKSTEKRGRGRPKKADKKPERVTAKATKHKGGRKTNESENQSDDVKQAMAVLKKAGYKVSKAASGAEELDEKAVSKKQQKFMGMVHATQKGEKAPSKEVAKVAKTMKKKDAEDFASTKHKGLPEKVKSKKKEEDVEESSVGGTTSGSVATASSGKSKGVFGKGIYDSMNREVEAMIAESMNISMNMSDNTEHGAPSKSLTVTATDEDALYLGKLLKMAGVGGGSEGGCGCGTEPCSCGSDAEVVDENSPDWPTDQETSDDALQYSGGLNGPKSSGQTVGAPFNRQNARQGAGELVGNGVLESDDLGDLKNLAGIQEAAKPDYIDLDKDGDKAEDMKKAAKDKAEKKVEESLGNLWKVFKG